MIYIYIYLYIYINIFIIIQVAFCQTIFSSIKGQNDPGKPISNKKLFIYFDEIISTSTEEQDDCEKSIELTTSQKT